jgi:hypothetical protein
MNTENIRKSVKIKMIELGLDKPGMQPELARAINANPNSLNMALTGHRQGQRSHEILAALLSFLENHQVTDGHVSV